VKYTVDKRKQDMIAVIDYGAGNIRSVVNAAGKLGFDVTVTSNPADVLAAEKVVLPGVGAAADTMNALKEKGLTSVIRQVIAEDKPFLGICIGQQILFSGTDEGGWTECLGVFSGAVRRLAGGVKIPHMGWNQVRQTIDHPVFQGIPDEACFYFVHSYYAVPEDRKLIAGETDYGVVISSVITSGNCIATQFHPEKSGEAGLQFFSNFLRDVQNS
jgi:glutamine amidotransferase